MLFGRVIEEHRATDVCTYELLQSDIVGTGYRDGVYCWSIRKLINGKKDKEIIKGVKNKEAAFAIWKDVKKGEQK